MPLCLSSRGAQRRGICSLRLSSRLPRSKSRATQPGTRTSRGFTLLELIIVVSVLLILISVAAPIYRTSIIRAKESVLRDDLFGHREPGLARRRRDGRGGGLGIAALLEEF